MSGARGGLAVAALFLTALFLANPQPAPARHVALGAYIPGADLRPGEIGRYARKVGARPLIVHIYKDWGNPAFQYPELRSIWRRGAVPMITWEPYVSLGRIANGGFDGYIRASARAAARWGKPFFVRFAHEMNGAWFPWGRVTRPAVYKAAWRHIVRVFRRLGAGNVRWVWTPFVDGGGLPFRSRYPGNRWVDWVGLDGYNWGGALGWRSFNEVFGRSYRILRRLSPRPMMLAEIGCGEVGGSKPRWLRRALLRQLPGMDRVRALVWFSRDDPRGDFRVDSSRSALRALRRSSRARLYQTTRRQLLHVPRDLRHRARPMADP